jgi:hypothetical protein
MNNNRAFQSPHLMYVWGTHGKHTETLQQKNGSFKGANVTMGASFVQELHTKL